MAPKRKRRMNKDQNKGRASKSHPTLQLARRLSEMTSQVAPDEISHPTDPLAGTSIAIPPPSIQGVQSPCISQPTNPDVGHTLDKASTKKRSAILKKLFRQQMADKVPSIGKASKKRRTIRHTRHVAMMSSEIPLRASLQAISPSTDPPPRSSEVILPSSIQGLHSPCTSRPTNPDAGHTRDTASKKRRVVRRKFDSQEMAEKDQNTGITFKSHPMKRRGTYPVPMTSQNSPYASQPTNSMEGVHLPARTSDVSPPASMDMVHSPRSSQPTSADAGRTGRSFVALETQSNDAKPILYLDEQGFLPSRPAANVIGDIIKRHFTDPWPSWKKIPISTRDSWFEEFQEKFSVCPPDHYQAKKNFETRGSVLMKNNLNKARTTMYKPNWIKDGVWERLCEYWRSEGFKKKSSQAKSNRSSDFGASHTGGSISASQHRANMMKETGVPPTPLELFNRMHQRKNKTWVDSRSQHVNETFTSTLKQLTKRASAEGKPPPSELDVWCDVARSKKGKIYGLGMESMETSHCPSSSPMEWVKKQEFDELMKEMEEVRNERDKLQVRVTNAERLVEHSNALVQELMESINMPCPMEEIQDEDEDDEIN